MRSTRFERRILLAMAIVALGPMFGALFLGRAALWDAYRTGVNPRFATQLERGVQAYRAHLMALREDAERTTDAIAFHWKLRASLVSNDRSTVERYLGQSLHRYPHVGSIEVLWKGAPFATARRAKRLDARRMRLLTRERVLGGEGLVRVVLVAPRRAFDEFQQAGEIAGLYARLSDQTNYVAGVYVWVYLGLLLAMVGAALGVGLILSRRVTRRVTALARATQRVGSGDLTVTVPSGTRDEVSELTEAFNAMVRDLRDTRARVEYLQRVSAWQDFARRLAHEIKNPLTPIQLAAQEMHQSYRGGDDGYRQKLEDARAIVEEEVATLRRLVGEFSAFAKLPQADLAPADLNDFVQDIEKSVPAIIEDLGAEEVPRVEVRRAPGPMPVRIDAMMLKRCLDNLIRNAVQAQQEGLPAQVIVATKRDGSDAILEIRDSGPGIPAADRERVFDPYYTTKSEGTGLGLAIVKKVVLEHGGEIGCESAPEGGACFRVTLKIVS